MLKEIFQVALAKLSLDDAFVYAGRRQDYKAWKYIRKSRFESLALYPHSVANIQYILLKMFLGMTVGEKVSPGPIFTHIRNAYINEDEKKLLTRYALSVLWISRGRQGECLLRIRYYIEFREELVRPVFRRRFSSSDIVETD